MRYASTYDRSGAPVVAELQGDRLVPLAGLTEVGEATTAEPLAAAARRTADAFPGPPRRGTRRNGRASSRRLPRGRCHAPGSSAEPRQGDLRRPELQGAH